MGSGAAILAAEIKIVAVPLGVDVHKVIESLILGRRFDPGFQGGFDKLCGLFLYFCLHRFGNLGFGRLRRAVYPRLLAFCHSFSPSFSGWIPVLLR